MSGTPGLLLAGRVGRPHGIAGEVYVEPISDDPRRFEPGSELVHESAGNLVVESCRRHRNRLLVKFAGVDDRTVAETVRGALYVSPERLRALAGDEYWEYEVVGCRVVDATGADVGVVTRVVPGSAQDLLAVDTERGERLVPMVSDIVVGVDIERRTVAVDPPLGLLD